MRHHLAVVISSISLHRARNRFSQNPATVSSSHHRIYFLVILKFFTVPLQVVPDHYGALEGNAHTRHSNDSCDHMKFIMTKNPPLSFALLVVVLIGIIDLVSCLAGTGPTCKHRTTTGPSFHPHHQPRSHCRVSKNILHRHLCKESQEGHDGSPTRLKMSFQPQNEDEANVVATISSSESSINWANVSLFGIVAIMYWYWMVLGGAAYANSMPFLPPTDIIPLDRPGWPVSSEDLAPALEDSYHFFYLSELLNNEDAPYVIAPRLAIFNFVEAWIFAMLPALWADTKRRLSRPILLGSWLLLGINLTNAFLAPYLLITEFRSSSSTATTTSDLSSPITNVEQVKTNKNMIASYLFGSIAIAVATYAAIQSLTATSSQDWIEFWNLVRTDRTYFAFCLDPCLFALFQPLILGRTRESQHNQAQPALDYVPFVGLILWLFETNPRNTLCDE